MPSFLLIIAYDGSAYSGWQRQAGFDTVQERLERSLQVIFGEPIGVEGASRTDAGVHALRQAACVRLPRQFEPGQLLRAMNGNLPRTISVRAVTAVPSGFHARFAAIGKRYVYRCAVDPVRPALYQQYRHWVGRPVDLAAMRQGARCLLGRHDFASFATNPGYVRKRGTVRTLQHVHVVQRPWGFDLCVQGDGFLYNMVRAIAGTLLDVGLGRYGPDRVAAILAARDRSAAGATAPARGLYLVRVLYPEAVVRLQT